MHARDRFTLGNPTITRPVLLRIRLSQWLQDSLPALWANQVVIRRAFNHSCNDAECDHCHQAYSHCDHLSDETKSHATDKQACHQYHDGKRHPGKQSKLSDIRFHVASPFLNPVNPVNPV
jgi:hypothetical protein